MCGSMWPPQEKALRPFFSAMPILCGRSGHVDLKKIQKGAEVVTVALFQVTNHKLD